MTDTGNISTIATTIWVSIIAPILLYFGVTIDQTLGIGVLTGILTPGNAGICSHCPALFIHVCGYPPMATSMLRL